MNKKLKILSVTVLSLVISVSFTACKSKEEITSGNVSSGNAVSSTAPTPPETTEIATSQKITEPDSSVTVYTMNCIINEIDGDRFVAEKLVDGNKSGILYEFHFASEGYNEGEEIVVEYKYPIANSFPYGLTNVNIYKAE